MSSLKAEVENIAYDLKIIVVGKGGVGKTSLLDKFRNERSNCYPASAPVSTLGIDYAAKIVQLQGKTIKLNLWDTTGQERFRSMVSNFFRGVHGALIVYDVTDPSSFEDIDYWEDHILKYCTDCESEIVKVLIGNKIDLNDRKISTEDGKERAKKGGMSFYETSAKEDLFVRIAFTELVTKILENDYIIKSIEDKEASLMLEEENMSLSQKCC